MGRWWKSALEWTVAMALAVLIHALVLALLPDRPRAPERHEPFAVRWIELPKEPEPEPEPPEPEAKPEPEPDPVADRAREPEPDAARPLAQSPRPEEQPTQEPKSESVTPAELFPDSAIQRGGVIDRLSPPQPRKPTPYSPATKHFAVRFKGAFRPSAKRVRDFGEALPPTLFERLNSQDQLEARTTVLPDDSGPVLGGACVGGCSNAHHRGHLEVYLELEHQRGRVRRVRIARRSQLPDFDRAALDAVRYIADFGADEAVEFGDAVETTTWKISADVYRWTRDELLLDPGFVMPGRTFDEGVLVAYSMTTSIELVEIFPDPSIDPDWRPK